MMRIIAISTHFVALALVVSVIPPTANAYTTVPSSTVFGTTTKSKHLQKLDMSSSPSERGGIHPHVVNDDNKKEQQQEQQRRRRLAVVSSQKALASRKNFLKTVILSSSSLLFTNNGLVKPAHALVKGNAPPPKMKPPSAGEKKCNNVEECQEMAERLASEEDAILKANTTPVSIASKGSRYKDLKEGDTTSLIVKDGDDVQIKFKVLKLGKRSYDGLSGEGTVVFSRGYGLEDDETTTQKTAQLFSFNLSDPTVIPALSDALPGMSVNGIRRINVLPQMGWERPSRTCDGGPGGRGAGGELKTDYVVVPTATMVATESCFDKTKRPFPTTYAQERRMAQRFDQSLIMEVELVGIGK